VGARSGTNSYLCLARGPLELVGAQASCHLLLAHAVQAPQLEQVFAALAVGDGLAAAGLRVCLLRAFGRRVDEEAGLAAIGLGDDLPATWAFAQARLIINFITVFFFVIIIKYFEF